MKKRVILFDLDGTLTDSGPGIKNCVKYALEKKGYEPLSEKTLTSFIGPPMVQQFQEVLAVSREEAEDLVHTFRERYAVTGIFENSLYPGIKELLTALKKKGFLLGVTSAKPMRFVDRVTEHYEIAAFFDTIQGALSDNEKPDKTEVIARSLKALGYENDRELVSLVGDRKYDAKGAALSKIGFYGVGWGYAAKGELEEAGAQKIVADAEELLKLICEDK